MIRTISNLIRISILFLSLTLFLFVFDSPLQVKGMKVHPDPVAKKRNIAIRDAMEDSFPSAGSLTDGGGASKRLRRLPHVFGKVLELPFSSDADVAVEESPDCFRFVAQIDGAAIGGGVRAHAVEIHPGVTKVVVRNGESGGEVVELRLGEVDVWRFRLPAGTQPELASAVFVDGELIVTVPKSGGFEREVVGGVGRLVLVR